MKIPRSSKIRTLILAAALSIGLCFVSPVSANIVSDSSWKSSDQFFQGWEQPSFDDTSWSSARAPYPSPTSPSLLIPGTSAQYIWHDPQQTSTDGGGGPDEVFLRLSFPLEWGFTPGHSDVYPVGSAYISVDDDYDFFVNGALVFSNRDQGFAHVVDFVDFSNYLRINEVNVLAIHAVDGGWGNPYDRSYQRVLVDARVAVIPEPEIYAMFLAGLGLMGFMARRRKQNAEPD